MSASDFDRVWSEVWGEIITPEVASVIRRAKLAITEDGKPRVDRAHGTLATEAMPVFDLTQIDPTDGAPYDTAHDQIAAVANAYVPGGTDVAVTDGGTGASTASGARTNLGVPAAGAALTEVAEASSTTQAGATSAVPGANVRCYDFFTLPTTETWYVVTKIEWKNGTTAAGTIWSGVEVVDGDPPSNAQSLTVAVGDARAQSGTSATQATTKVASQPIRGGTVCGVWVSSNNATSTFGKTTVASENHKKSVTAGYPATGDGTSWTADTDGYYVKAFFRGIV